MNQAIGGQVISAIQYIGQPILTAVGSEILPRKFRPIAQAGLNGAGALGAIFSLLVGTALTSNNLYGWRNVFYIGAAMMGASAIIIALLYNPLPRPLQKSLTLKEKLSRLDWVAYILLASSLVLFVMGLTWAYNPYPWTDTHVLTTLIIGGVLFIALIVHQTWFKKDGLIPHALFKKDRNFAVALGCFFADGMIFWAANSYFAYQVSVLYETDAMLVSLHFCIAFFVATVAAVSVGFITVLTKAVREPIVVSFVMFTLFFGTFHPVLCVFMQRLTQSSSNGRIKSIKCHCNVGIPGLPGHRLRLELDILDCSSTTRYASTSHLDHNWYHNVREVIRWCCSTGRL